MAACPTPEKSRFATRAGAESAAARSELALGLLLRPYDCVCGWVHLSKAVFDEIPADAEPDPAIVNRLRWLPDDRFTDVVRADTTGTADVDTRVALRHPRLRGRWRRVLRDLAADIDRQMAARAGDVSRTTADWRQRAAGYRDSLTIRAREAGALADHAA